MKVVSIFSGGLDSTILLYKLVNEYKSENVFPIIFEYGQRHDIEVIKARTTCQKLNLTPNIINLSFLGDIIKGVSCLSKTSNLATPDIKEVLGESQPLTYVPFRNGIFTMLALSYAESINANKVFIGVQTHDLYGYFDTIPEFYKRFNSLIELNRKNLITIETPFINLSKKDEIEIGLKLNVPFEDTWSCYNPQVKTDVVLDSLIAFPSTYLACGKCATCAERIMNFAKAGIKDNIKYNISIDWDYLISEWSVK